MRGCILGRWVLKPGNAWSTERLGTLLEEWLSQWKAGAYIVGYANIGAIRFQWTPDAKDVAQRLWWRHADEPHHPTMVTEYRDTLERPSPDAAPPLP